MLLSKNVGDMRLLQLNFLVTRSMTLDVDGQRDTANMTGRRIDVNPQGGCSSTQPLGYDSQAVDLIKPFLFICCQLRVGV